MQVNATNAAIVAAVFDKLSDERFNMRTLDAIRRNTQIATDQEVLDVATEMGAPILRRLRDNAPLVTRPIIADGSRRMTHLECREYGDKALSVAAGEAESFDLPTFRVTFTDAASQLPSAPSSDDDDDDEQVGEE